jgi:tetratricopeptide (TPR) repeat protein
VFELQLQELDRDIGGDETSSDESTPVYDDEETVWYALEDSEYDTAEVEQEKRRFADDMTLTNFGRLLTTYLFNYRTYRSLLLKQIWDITKVMHTLPQNGEPDQVQRIFDTMLDLIEENEDVYGFDVINRFPYNLLDVVQKQALRMLGPSSVTAYKVGLIKVYQGVAVWGEIDALLKLEESSLDVMRTIFPKSVVSPPTSGPPLDENFVEDSVRGIRYVYALGLVYSEADLWGESQSALETALELSRSAETSDVYFNARLSDAKNDLTLCQSRILRALAQVRIRQDDPRQALDHLEEARTLELSQAEDLKLPDGYVDYLRAVGHALVHPPLTQLELGDYLLPGQYWDGLALLIEVRASIGPAEEAVELVEWGVSYFHSRLPKPSQKKGEEVNFQDTTRHCLYSLVLQRLKMKSAAPQASWRDVLEAHLEFIRTIRVLELQSPEYVSVMREAVKLMNYAVQDGSADSLTFARDSGEYVLAEFSIDEPEAEPELQAVVIDVYQVLADVSYRRRDLAGFLENSLLAGYVRLVVVSDEEVLPGSDTEENGPASAAKKSKSKFDEIRLERVIDLAQKAFAARPTVQAEQASEVLFLLDNGLKDLWDVSATGAKFADPAPRQTSKLLPLKELSKIPAMAVCRDYLSTFHFLLQTREVGDALTAVRDEVDNPERSLSGGYDSQSCSRRSVRSVGVVCFDTVTDEARPLKSEERVEEIISSLGPSSDFLRAAEEGLRKVSVGGFSLEQAAEFKYFLESSPEQIPHSLDSDLQSLSSAIGSGDSSDVSRMTKNLHHKIRTAGETLGFVLSILQAGTHTLRGDVEGLGTDSLNLYVLPKLGAEVSVQVGELGSRLDSEAISRSAPIIGRVLTDAAAFLGLYRSIEEEETASESLDKLGGGVNIVSNAIFISVDLGSATLGGGIEAFAAPLSVAVIVAEEMAQAALRVVKLEQSIELLAGEEHSLFWTFLSGGSLPDYLVQDLGENKFLHDYLSTVMTQYDYDFKTVYLSLPVVVKNYIQVVFAGKNFAFQEVCSVKEIPQTSSAEPPGESVVLPDAGLVGRKLFSRLLPQRLGGLVLVCGPAGDGNVAYSARNRTVVEPRPLKCPHGQKPVLTERSSERLSVGRETPECVSTAVYRKVGSDGDGRSLYHLHADRGVVWGSGGNATIVFRGKKLFVGGTSRMSNNVNR